MSRGEPKIIIPEAKARAGILEGARIAADTVSKVYGSVSGNVGIQRNYGHATISHDGVTVLKEIFLSDETMDIGVGLLTEASEKTNNTSGDGTTCSAILAYHIMNLANQRIAAGYNSMGLRRGIDKAALWIKEELDKQAVKIADKDLAKVAAISASDPEVGQLVADTVLKVGGVGITVEQYDGLGVLQDVIEGVYFEKGWSLPHFVTDVVLEEAAHLNASILILEKKVSQNQDIVPILEMIYRDTEHKTVLVVGNVDGQAIQTCALTNANGKVKVCVVRPPVYGDQELPFLEDIAALTGGKLVTSSMPADKVTKDFLGFAEKVVVAKESTTIMGGKGDHEQIQIRLDNIHKQLKSDEYSAPQKERMEMRLAKLQGTIGIIKVGGATPSDAKEMKDRVEDAIHATRAAKEQGVVPGGATTLARLSQLYRGQNQLGDSFKPPGALPTNEFEGVKVVLEALAEPFKQLMANAGDEGGYRFPQLLKSKAGYGFDVKNMTAEPIDIVAKGILDPVKVIKSVVENACSAAGLGITIPATIEIDRKYQLDQIALNKANMQG